jgi:hypothetical protein
MLTLNLTHPTLLLASLRWQDFSIDEVDRRMKEPFLGPYCIVERYSPKQLRFIYSIEFETEKDKMWFILKYGE